MPVDAIEFVGDIATQCRCDFKMMTADRQIHTTPPENDLTISSSNMPDQSQAPPLCAQSRKKSIPQPRIYLSAQTTEEKNA
jgi:hypothetical protein